jgi:hypothetical protein
MLFLWLDAVADQRTHIDDAVSFSWSLENTNRPRKESLCWRRSLWMQQGEFQKDKANVHLSDYLASELRSIRGNTLKWRALWKCGRSSKHWFFSKWWFRSSQYKPIWMQENYVITSAYFWTTCCVLWATRVCKSKHFTSSIKIIYFPSHVSLTYILMKYYWAIEQKNAVNVCNSCSERICVVHSQKRMECVL